MSDNHLDFQRGFVGRNEYVAAIRDLSDSRRDGAGILVLEGVAGIGKSTLLEQALLQETDRDDVAHIRFSQLDPSPMDAVADLVGQIVGTDLASQLTDKLRSDGPDAHFKLADHRTAIVAEAARAIVQRSIGSDTTIVVDDLHWCHPTAVRFFELLTDEIHRRRVDSHVLLILAFRPLPSDSSLRIVVERILRASYAHRLELPALDALAEAALVRTLRPAAPPSLLGFVRRSARGNPLQIQATLAIALRRGLDGPASVVAEELVGRVQPDVDGHDPVTAWLADMDRTLTTVLSGCAVLGDDFDVNDVLTLGSVPEAATLQALDNAVKVKVLQTDGGRFWFRHSQYREVLYELMDTFERMAIHDRCAAVIAQKSSSRASDDVAIGNHLLSGRRPADNRHTEAYIRAGHASLATSSWAEASRYFEAALHTSASNGKSVPAGLQLAAGKAHYFNHDPASAEPHLRAAIGEAIERDDEDAHCEAVVQLMWSANSMAASAIREPTDLGFVDRFLSSALDPRRRSRVLEVRAEALIAAGQIIAGRETAEEALGLARHSKDEAATAFARFAIGYSHLSLVEIGPAVKALTEAARIASRADDWYLRSGVHARLAFALFAAGDLRAADATAVESIELARRQTEYSAPALAGAVRAGIAVCRGDFRLARSLVDSATLSAHRSGHNVSSLFLAPIEVHLALQQDGATEAGDALDRWPELPRSIRSTMNDLISSTRGSAASDQRLDAPSAPNLLSSGLVAARAETALRRSDHQVLQTLLPVLQRLEQQGLAVPPGYPVLLARLVGDVEAALGSGDGAEAAYERAAAFSQAQEMYPDLARSRLGIAICENNRSGGSRDSALRNATEAAALGDRLGLGDVIARARSLLRSELDSHAAVEARGSDWRVILSSDVEGSTAISSDLGDLVYHRVISSHNRILAKACDRYGGVAFSDGGDGQMVWFSDTMSAVHAAIAIQDSVRLQTPEHLAVKVGLAGGEPLIRSTRPFGLVVNRAARMEGLAVGGEILLDEAVAADLRDRMPTEDRGAAELKGIGRHRVTALLFENFMYQDPSDSRLQAEV